MGFVFVNIDDYSSFANAVELKFINIERDIRRNFPKRTPIVIAGGIGFETARIKKAERVYRNTIEEDSDNELLFKTTVHGGNGNNDDKQRDFILLKDTVLFTVVYSRILSGNLQQENTSQYKLF